MLTIILLIILLAGEFRVYFTEIIATTPTTTDIEKKLNTTCHLTWLSNEDDDSTDVMYREDLFEGDIVFINNGTTISNRMSTTFEILAIQHNAVRQKTLLWPHGRVPYIISHAYANTSLFIGGKQEVSLGDGCLKKGIVIHELMHVLGFFHEQKQFDKYAATIIDDLGSPYDYDSVMHYSAVAFSKNAKPTIIPKSIDKVIKIGQRYGLSSIDVWKINKLYKCVKKISMGSASNVQNLENGEQPKKLEMQVSGTIRGQFATTMRTITVSFTLSTHNTVTVANTSNNNSSTRTKAFKNSKLI